MPGIEKKSSQDKTKEITDKLEKGIMELFEGDKFKEYLNTMSKFHNYSFNNTMLIALQKPDASLVAGFNSWKNKFERNVNKGEKGIQIFAPAPYTIKKEQEKLDPDTKLPVLDENGKPEIDEVEIKIPAFKVVSVFDVSQTSGKELPTLGADELQGEVKDYEKFFDTLKQVSPVPIEFKPIDGTAKGFFSHADKSITINEGMSEVQTIKTAVHEIAHTKLHDRDLKKSDIDKPKDRNTEEVEAESIAYTVCQYFGIDTSDYSFGYVAAWGSGKELPELKSSLETIRSTASELINQISDKLLGLEKAQEKIAEKPEKSNIIGNTAFSAIEDKQYFRLKSNTAEKVADYLTDKNVPFSGRINGDKTTITVSEKNVPDYKNAVAEAMGKDKAEPKQEQSQTETKKPDIIGNTPYKSISDKSFVKLSTEKALAVASILDEQGVKFSGRTDGDKTTLTISKADMDSYKSAVKSLEQEKIADGFPEPKVSVESHPHFENEFILKEVSTGGILHTGTREDIIDFCKEKLAESVIIPQLEIMLDKAETDRPKINHFDIPLYKNDYTIANDKNEIQLYRDSHKENCSCSKAIDKAIANNYKDNRLDTKSALESVMQEYPLERIAHVTATRVVASDWDGRFYKKTKDWAKNECSGLSEMFMKKALDYYLNEHPGLVNLFADRVIEKQLEIEKDIENVVAESIQQDMNAEITYTGKLPDENITIADRNAFGYTSNELLPLTEEKALEFFDNEVAAVFLLYEDNTEGQANERFEIENHKGIFGIETKDWEKIVAIQEHTASLEKNEPSREAILFHGKEDAIGIYQLKDGKDTRDIRFVPLEHLERNGEVPHREDYILVYTRKIEDNQALDKDKLLDDIYDEFNLNHPKDFVGHSLSVSDIVVIQHNGDASAHYVDNFGFKELQNFGEIQKNHLKAVEDAVEQNDNSFDGIINNTPSVSELEEKAKNGEPINLSDLCKAVKNEQKNPTEKPKPVRKPSIIGQIKAAKQVQKEQSKDKPKEKGMEI